MPRLIECGCCGYWHEDTFHGDCRDNSERYESPEDYARRNRITTKDIRVTELNGQVYLYGPPPSTEVVWDKVIGH
jgi:hypothetical protein